MERLTLVLTGVIVIASLAVPVAGATIDASVTDVEVAPSTPAPGESVTLTATIKNRASSTSALDVQSVAVRSAGGGINEYARVRNVGRLSPGTSLDLPLTISFDSAGQRDLRVIVYGNNGIELRYPVIVDVEEQHPQLDIQANESVEGVESTGTVTVANGLSSDISNVRVTVEGSEVEMTEKQSVLASLASGESATSEFGFRPESAGRHNVTATVQYSIEGTSRTVSQTTEIRTKRAKQSISLTGIDVTREGEKFQISGSASNIGTSDIESVLVSVKSTDGVDPAMPNREYFVGTIPASDFVSFDVYARTDDSTSAIPLEVSYLINGERQQQTIPVTVADSTRDQQVGSTTDGGMSGSIAIVLGAVITLAVGVIIVIGWRSQRDGS